MGNNIKISSNIVVFKCRILGMWVVRNTATHTDVHHHARKDQALRLAKIAAQS